MNSSFFSKNKNLIEIKETLLIQKNLLTDIEKRLTSHLSETAAQKVTQDALSAKVNCTIAKFFFVLENSIAEAVTLLETKSTLDGVELRSQFNSATSSLEKYIGKEFEKQTKYIDEKLKDLPEITAERTSLSVVGEAYTCFDSRRSYHPTLIFLFLEKTKAGYPRRSQIKLRLKKENSELTLGDQENLRISTASLKGLTYSHGTARGYYVAADKRYKTTLFATNKLEIEKVLTALLPIIGESYVEQLLSLTLNGKSRPSTTKRKFSLGKIPLNKTVYNENFLVELYRVKLLVNGLDRPISLYP